MRQSLEKLVDSLQEQKEHLGDILKLSYEIRAIIVDKDVHRLGVMVRKELEAIKKMNACEKNLMLLLPVVAEELGLKKDDLTLSDIISHLEAEERSIIQALRDSLTTGLRELAELNIENQEYIDTRLDYSEYVFDLLVAEEDPLNNFYGDDG